jgi:hypothetical protein
MARITVANEINPAIVAIIRETSDADGEIWYDSVCQACGQVDTDRGAFADTIEAASIHVDLSCPRLNG